MMHKHLVQIYNKCAKRRHVHTKNEAALVVVFPFVQCGLVAPLTVDGSPDSVSHLVVWGLTLYQRLSSLSDKINDIPYGGCRF